MANTNHLINSRFDIRCQSWMAGTNIISVIWSFGFVIFIIFSEINVGNGSFFDSLW